MNKCIAPGLRILAVTSPLLALSLSLAQARTPAGPAQSPQPTTPTCAPPTTTAFDVATIKPSQAGPGDADMGGSADSFTASASVFHLIGSAYDLRDFQIVDGPDWIKSSTWDITAKVDLPPADWSTLSGAAQNAIENQRAQAVLAQRFALKCHFETRELPVYNLVLAKGGSKLTSTPADAANKGSIHGSGRNHQHHVEGKGVELGDLARLLSLYLGRTVIDKTGLTGLYDFTLTYTSDADAGSPASADEPSGPTIFTALEEQLGLKLEPAKGPVPILVIDSAEKPSEN